VLPQNASAPDNWLYVWRIVRTGSDERTLRDAAQTARFAALMDAGLLISSVFLSLDVLVTLLGHNGRLLVGVAIMVAFCAVAAASRALAMRGHIELASTIAGVATLALSVPISLVYPAAGATVAVTVVLAAAIVLTFLDGSRLRWLLTASVVTSLITGCIIARAQPSAAAPWFMRVLVNVASPTVTTLVALLLLAQNRSSLVQAFRREAAARRAAEDATQRTEQLVDELRAALHARDEFIALASHELRTPLTSLLLRTESLQRAAHRSGNGGQPPDRLEQTTRAVHRQAERLAGVVRGLLDVTRMRTDGLELYREHFDLAELVRAVLTQQQSEIENAASAVTLRADEAVNVHGDRLRIEMALTHLLSNALKFGERKPIEIEVAADGDRARVIVRDHGIGIETELQGRIFEQYVRGVPIRNYGGFGLGLWFVRQVACAHGGTITVESRPGDGSTFTLELPRDRSRVEPYVETSATVRLPQPQVASGA
jgi:signal transduction histidine kinase